MDLQSHIRHHAVHSDNCTLTFTSVFSTYITYLMTFCSITRFIFSVEYKLQRAWNFLTKIHYTFLVLPIRRLYQVCQLMAHCIVVTQFSVTVPVRLPPFLSLFLSRAFLLYFPFQLFTPAFPFSINKFQS